jgi:hypothetical protein
MEGVKVGQVKSPRWPGDALPHPHTRATHQSSNHEIWGPNDFSHHASNRQGAPSCWRHTSMLPTLPVAVLTPISVRRHFRPHVPYVTLLCLDPSKPLEVCWIYTVTYCMIRYVHFDTHEWNTPHYFQLKTHLFKHFSETKIRDALKFEIPFFTIGKSQKRHFPLIRSGLTDTPVNYTNVICWREFFSPWKFTFKSEARHKPAGVLNSNSNGSLQDSCEYKVGRGLHKYWLCSFKRTGFSSQTRWNHQYAK